MDHIPNQETKNFKKYILVGLFVGGGCRPFLKMINIFAYTSPNRSGVGAIDNPDRFEQIFDTTLFFQQFN